MNVKNPFKKPFRRGDKVIYPHGESGPIIGIVVGFEGTDCLVHAIDDGVGLVRRYETKDLRRL